MMIYNNKHNLNSGNSSDLLFELTEKIKVPTSNINKEEAWQIIFEKITNDLSTQVPSTTLRTRWYILAAATVACIMGLFIYFKFAKNTIVCPPGKQLTYKLPDNSIVILNAETQITFPKYFYFNSRKILLKGEAFFEVTHGKDFIVTDRQKNKVEVLGTRFNVVFRDTVFKVQCVEGKVSVSTYQGQSVKLSKGQEAHLVSNEFRIESLSAVNQDGPSWTKGEFYFQASRFTEVINELQRQFNVKIECKGFDPYSKIYTGVFTNKSLNEALNLVCIPMNFNYSVLSDTLVIISNLP